MMQNLRHGPDNNKTFENYTKADKQYYFKKVTTSNMCYD